MTGRTTLPAQDVIAVLAVALLWGGNVIAVKVATASIPPFMTCAIRFALVGLILCPFYRPQPGMLRHVWPVAVVMGIGHFGLLFLGLSGVDSATGSVAVQLGVPFSVILSRLFLGERLDGRRIAGLALAFSGVVVLAGAPGHADLQSVATVIFADLMWAVSMLLIKRAPPIPPMIFNGWMALFTSPMLLLISFATERTRWSAVTDAPLAAWGGVAFTIVGASLIAYTLWYKLLRAHSLNRVVPYTLLSPAVAFAIGSHYLGETITTVKIVGALMTLAGVAVIEIRIPASVSDTETT